MKAPPDLGEPLPLKRRPRVSDNKAVSDSWSRGSDEHSERAGLELRGILNALPLPVIALDSECRVTLWTPAAEHSFGGSAEEGIGQPTPLVPEDKWPAYARAIDLVFEHGKAWRNVEVLRTAKD